MSDKKVSSLGFGLFGFLALITISILAGLAYDWEIALQTFCYGILCWLVSFVGLIPIAGPFIYWLIMNSISIQLPSFLQFAVFAIGLAHAILSTIITTFVIALMIKL